MQQRKERKKKRNEKERFFWNFNKLPNFNKNYYFIYFCRKIEIENVSASYRDPREYLEGEDKDVERSKVNKTTIST